MKKETIAILFTVTAVLLSFLIAVLPTYIFQFSDPDIPADLEQNRIIGNTKEGTNPGAPVEIIVFEDFNCIHCAEFEDTLIRIMVVYGDKVNIISRHFPELDGSRIPALAVECAREQGSYWEYHGNIFKSDGHLTPTDMILIADDTGLDLTRFGECLDQEQTIDIIENDLEIAADMLVRGTPTTFINSKKIEGDAEYARFKKIIDEELSDD